jgi:N-acetylglucosamine kinase-like BadF-type ATPase
VTAASGAGAKRDGVVLAVDGGGVKTDLALLQSSGRLLSLVRGGRSQAHYLGVEGCVEVLESLLESAIVRAGLDSLHGRFAATAQILLAGADLPEELAALRARFEQLNWSDRLVIGNDTEALLRAGTNRGWGIAVVCGGGINCFGLASDGREARFLSFGAPSGDWGGGADIGLAALAAAVRGADRRGPRTVLENAVPAHFGLGDPLEVARVVHLRQMPTGRLRELAPVVLAASEQDAVAAGIVHRVADEVIAFASAALRRLELTTTDPDVVLGGGVLRAMAPTVIETIATGVRKMTPAARVVLSPSEPIVGAALLGLDALAADPRAAARARAELDEAIGKLATDAGNGDQPSTAGRPRAS